MAKESFETTDVGQLISRVAALEELLEVYEKTAVEQTDKLYAEIAERKRAEEALQKSEANFRRLLESAPDAMVIANAEHKILMVNEQFEEMFGYDREEILGKEVEILIPSHFNHQWQYGKSYIDAREGRRPMGQMLELYAAGKDGNKFPVEISLSPLETFDGIIVSAAIRDITERKRAEEELSRLATAVEQIAEGILITDTEGTILYANPAFERTSGSADRELLGRNLCVIQQEMCYRADGLSVWDTINRGELWRGNISRRRKDGSPCESEATYSPVRDRSGHITNHVIVERDVTHEKQLEAQLRQAQKLEAIGTLAGGIAHDFNNILGIIMGYTQLVMFSVPEGDDQTQDYLKDVLGASHRAKDLITQILAFSRKSEQERQPTQIGLIIKEALKMLRASLPATIEIRHDIASKQVVLADPTQIHQVLMNLCTNAAHAMRNQGGILEVSIADLDLDADFSTAHSDLHPGPYLLLTVKDTGHGMDATILERIFDPYFTTKPQGEGTGLGLAVVHGIVKGHGGTITVRSEPGKGSTFEVYFPRFGNPVLSAVAGTDPIPTGNERILFVDDEDGLCKSAKGILQRLGYRVTVSMSSVKALETFRQNPHEFDLVITDLTMPHMTGIQIAKEMLSIRADTPIILCSGFREMMTPEKAQATGIREFLLKPLIMADLGKAVRRSLDGGGSPL